MRVRRTLVSAACCSLPLGVYGPLKTDEMLRNDPAPPSRASLVRRIELIGKRGYEEHVSQTLPGITDLCFPIVDHSGHAVATLTQPYLRQRDVKTSVAEARAAHAETVQEISRQLGAQFADAP